MKYRIFCAIALLILFLCPLPAWAANPSQVVQLQTLKSCQSCDLTSAYLPVSNLDYTYLLAADLSKANLIGASITCLCWESHPNSILAVVLELQDRKSVV